MQYRENVTITVGFISLILVLLIILFSCFKTVQQKNTEKQYLVIILLYRARSSEPQVNPRDQPIVFSEVGLQLKIDQYS